MNMADGKDRLSNLVRTERTVPTTVNVVFQESCETLGFGDVPKPRKEAFSGAVWESKHQAERWIFQARVGFAGNQVY